MVKAYIALDNGTSGTWAMVAPGIVLFVKVPVKNHLSYTKEEKHTDRLDWRKAIGLLKAWTALCKLNRWDIDVLLERPMVNPGRWSATLNAIRCLEAESICLELQGINNYTFTDSRTWQSALLPDIKGSEYLKEASKMLGVLLFPEYEREIAKHKDADSLLMAQWKMEYDLGYHQEVKKCKKKKSKDTGKSGKKSLSRAKDI